MQILSIDLLVYCWSISILIHPIYWTLFGPNSKLEGMGVRFFETPIRSIILSETIGIGGSIITLLLDIENLSTVVFLVLFVTPIVIMSVLISQKMRKSIKPHQTSISSDENS